jgi:hypothetical protein
LGSEEEEHPKAEIRVKSSVLQSSEKRFS